MRTGAVISVCLIAVLILGGVMTQRVTYSVSETYIGAAETLAEWTKKEDWQRAAEAADRYCRSWKATTRWLQMLIDHADTDEVTMALYTVRAGIEAEDLVTCCVGCRQLTEAAEHIYHRGAFTLGNIL